MSSIYLYLGVYLIILFSIVFYVKRKETPEDFLMSGRNRGWWNIMFSKFAGAVGVAWFLSYTAYAYDYGFGVYIIVLGFLLGYALFAFWIAPKIYTTAKENKFYTQGDLVGYQTNCDLAKKITDIFSALTHGTWLLVATIGGAKIIENLGIFSYELSAFLILLIILIYILLGGYKVVLITDVFQGIIIIILLLLLSYNIVGEANIATILSEETGRVSLGSIIGFFLYGTLVTIALSDRYQLCYAAKDKKSIKIGMFLTAFPIIIVATLLLLIGLFMHIQNPALDSSLVFLEAMKNHISPTLLPLGMVLFFAGLMSSADTSVYSMSSHLALLGKKEKGIKNIKSISILVIIATYIIAYFFRSVIGVTIFGAGMSIVMAIPMIYIIKGGKSSYTFTYSLITGGIGFLIGLIFIGLEPSIVPLIVIGGLIGLLCKKRKNI